MTAAPDTALTSADRPLGSTTQAFGLLLMGLADVVYLIGGLVWGGAAPILAIAAAPALICAVLVRRFGLWATIVGLVATLATAAMTFWIAFGLFAVNSAVEFTGGLMFVFGFVLALVGGIRAIVKRRDPRTSPTRGERRTRTVIVSIVAAGAVASVVVGFLTRETITDEEAGGAERVQMDDFEFVPVALDADAGTVSFVFHNSDAFTHTFTIDELDVDEFVAPGSDQLVTFSAEPGTYTFYCMPHSNKGDGLQQESDMIGTLEVS